MTADDAHAQVEITASVNGSHPVWQIGADRVRLGSDHPSDMADPDPAATVRATGLDEATRAAALHGNAEREVGRVAVAGGQRA